jgi:hypothetical protein
VVPEEVELRIEITPQEEIEEDNNKVSINLDLVPNLDFDGEKLNFSKTSPAVGDKITITAFVENTGGDAEDVVIKFFDGTKEIGRDTIDIDYDKVGEASIEWTIPDKDGETLNIKAEIDAEDADGHEETFTKGLKVGGTGGVDDLFSMSGIIMLLVGLIIGAILFFIIGRASGGGRGGQTQPQGPQGMAGPSFGAFEKEDLPSELQARHHLREWTRKKVLVPELQKAQRIRKEPPSPRRQQGSDAPSAAGSWRSHPPKGHFRYPASAEQL